MVRLAFWTGVVVVLESKLWRCHQLVVVVDHCQVVVVVVVVGGHNKLSS